MHNSLLPITPTLLFSLTMAGVTTGFRQVPLTCPGHTRPVVHLHFSDLNSEGQFKFITASKDAKPMLHQGTTGDWIGTFTGHKGAVWGCCLNREATQAATGAADFTAKLWNAHTGSELASFTHKHIVKSVDFSHDGTRLVTGCNDKLVRIFSIEKPSEESAVIIEGHTNAIKSAIWIANPNMIVSSEENSNIKLWDVRTCNVVREIALPGPVLSIELSKDLSQLTVSHTNGVTFLDATTVEILKSYQIPSTCGKVNSASLHPSKTHYVTGGEDFKLYKYNYDDGKEVESYKGHFGPVHCVRYSPDGHFYCSGSEDGTVRLWQHTVGETYGLWKNPHENGVQATTNN